MVVIISTVIVTIEQRIVDEMQRRKDDIMCVVAAFNARRLPCSAADCASPANVRLARMLLMSFVLVALQLPQPAQPALIRIPTGSPPV